MTNHPIEKGWSLRVLQYGEDSPLENHGALELGADDENKLIYGSETFIRAMGMNSIMAACRSYVNKKG